MQVSGVTRSVSSIDSVARFQTRRLVRPSFCRRCPHAVFDPTNYSSSDGLLATINQNPPLCFGARKGRKGVRVSTT